MFCPKCGNTVADDSVFCGNCGTPMQRSAAPVAAAPAGAAVAPKASNGKLKIVIAAVIAVVIIAVVAVVLVNCLGPKKLQDGVYRINADGDTSTFTVSEGDKVSMTVDGETQQCELEYAGTWKGSNVFRYVQGTSDDYTVDKDGWVYDSKGTLTGSKLENMKIALPNGYANGNIAGSWAYGIEIDDGSSHSTITGSIVEVNKDGTITMYTFYGDNASISLDDALNYDYASMTYQSSGSSTGTGTSQTADGLSVMCSSGAITWEEASKNTYRITYPYSGSKTKSFTVSFPSK